MGSRAANIKGLNVGQLKDLLTIQQNIPTRDDIGGSVPHWTDVTTMWAKIMPYRGSRSPFAEQNRTTLTHYVITSYFPTPAINSTMKVVYGSREFQLVYIEDVDELHEWFYMELMEGVPT